MKRIYLAVAAAILTLTGAALLADPFAFLSSFGARLEGAAAAQALRGFGGFYLGFAAWLAVALARPRLYAPAVISATAVMAGFLAGRAAGLACGGGPTARLMLSAAVELVLFAWGLFLSLGKAER